MAFMFSGALVMIYFSNLETKPQARIEPPNWEQEAFEYGKQQLIPDLPGGVTFSEPTIKVISDTIYQIKGNLRWEKDTIGYYMYVTRQSNGMYIFVDFVQL